MVPVIHVEGVKPGQMKLTGAVLADIYLGKVTKWNDPAITALNPGAYKEWTERDLKKVLSEHGAEPYKSDGRMVVGAEQVYGALTRRQDESGEPDEA